MKGVCLPDEIKLRSQRAADALWSVGEGEGLKWVHTCTCIRELIMH